MPAILTFLGYDPIPPLTTIGELRQGRRRHGWTTSEAARQRGVDRTTWQDRACGELILFRKHRTKVAKLLDLDQQGLDAEMRARHNGKHRR